MGRIAVGVLLAMGLCAPSSAQMAGTTRADGPAEWGRARLVERLRVGSIDGDPNYTFGDVGGVLEIADGDVWIGDEQLGAVRRYDRNGIFLDQLGRRGDGPGEFRYPHRMRQLPDGSIAVWDNGQVRVSRFDPAGGYLSSFSPPTYMIGGAFQVFERAPGGNLYLIAGSARSDPGSPHRTYWLELTSTGEIRDSIPRMPANRVGIEDGITGMTTISPLGYRVTGRTDEFAIELQGPEGTLRIERTIEDVPYQRAERAEKQRREDVFAEVNGVSPRRIPRNKPVFKYLWVDSDGRIWVQLYVAGIREAESDASRASRVRVCEQFGVSDADCDARAREWYEPAVFDVIDPSGRYLGRLTLSNPETRLVGSRGDTLWVVEKGEYGEEYVVAYRIEKEGR
jgi:hypothetical protein